MPFGGMLSVAVTAVVPVPSTMSAVTETVAVADWFETRQSGWPSLGLMERGALTSAVAFAEAAAAGEWDDTRRRMAVPIVGRKIFICRAPFGVWRRGILRPRIRSCQGRAWLGAAST